MKAPVEKARAVTHAAPTKYFDKFLHILNYLFVNYVFMCQAVIICKCLVDMFWNANIGASFVKPTICQLSLSDFNN